MKAHFLLTAALAMSAFLIYSIPAQAKGTVRVQQPDGAVQTYDNVTFRVVNKTLRIETADKVGTLVITDAACSLNDKILMCLPYAMVLHQGGQKRPLDFHSGTVYFNKSSSDKQQLKLSSTQLPPNGVLGVLKSTRGTYVTFSGTLDSSDK